MQLQHVYTGKYLCVNSSHTSSTLESTNLRVTFLFSTVSLVKRISVYWLCIVSLYICHWHCGIVTFHWYFVDGTIKWEFTKLHFHGPPTIQSWFSRGWGKLQNVYRSLICCTNGVVCEAIYTYVPGLNVHWLAWIWYYSSVGGDELDLYVLILKTLLRCWSYWLSVYWN